MCSDLFAHGGKTQRLQTLWRMSVNDKTSVGKAVSLLREAANLLAGDRESEGNEDTAVSSDSLSNVRFAVHRHSPQCLQSLRFPTMCEQISTKFAA